jgi:uncharacterized membrane protein YfhO
MSLCQPYRKPKKSISVPYLVVLYASVIYFKKNLKNTKRKEFHFMTQTSAGKRHVLLASFLLPMAAMAAVFALCGLTPFGTRTLGVMDMPHQYLSFLYSLRDIVSGKASALYLPSMCLGGNMLGVAAYYLTSPLNLLTGLFSRENMYLAVSLLYFLRVGLCGLTMSVYTGQRYGYDGRCLVSALAYSFMGYLIAYCFNYLWQDCVVLLPILALGIARLAQGKGHWLYTITLGAALFLNFYIGYILCLFSVLFFFYEFFSQPPAERTQPWKTVGRFALSSLLAGALAAGMLLPAFLSLSGGKAEFSLSVLELTTKFTPAEFFSKFYTGAFTYEEIMPEGLPNVFCGTATMALAILYFFNGRIPRRRRILTGCFLALLAVSFWISALDLIWHCLNTPSWYNYRYSFLFSFLIAAAAHRELVEQEGTKLWHSLVALALVAVVSAYVFVGKEYDYVTAGAAWEALAVTALVGAGLYLLRKKPEKKRLSAGLLGGLILLQLLDVGANAKLSLTELTVPASDSAAYAQYVTEKEQAFAALDTGDTYIRVESTTMFDMNRCEAMLFGYDGISHYGSTLSQKSLDFLEKLGLCRYTDLWALYDSGVTRGADSLLGIGYLVSQSQEKDYPVLADTGSYVVLENPTALPIAWTADKAIGQSLDETDSLSYLDAFYAAAAPEVEQSLYTPAAVTDITLENYAQSGYQYTRLTDGMASITYTLTVAADGALYAQFGMEDFPGVMVYVNGAYVSYYATAQTNGTLFLGDFQTGDTVTVTVQTATDMTMIYAAFATENVSALEAYTEALSQGGCPLTKLSASHYTGTFTTGEGDELLVFTIPYDEAWTVTLDGKTVTAQEVQDCLMAVSVTPGEHTVELRYVPAGLVAGLCVSALAVVVCLAWVCWERKRKAA